MQYKLGNILGKGSFGIVYELLDEEKKCSKVIKFVRLSSYGIQNYIENYILLYINNPYICKAHKIILENNLLLKIIQDKADCDLKKILHNIPKKEERNITNQICLGVNYLHSRNIIHGDIKPNNILKFGNNYKISDFGLSRLSNGDNYIENNMYTLIYRPPEIKSGYVYLKSDIWALGCTIYEIYYNIPYFEITSTNQTYHINKNFTKEKLINNLINLMIVEKVNSRINSYEVLKILNIGNGYDSDYINIDYNKCFKEYGLTNKADKKVFVNKMNYGELKTNCIGKTYNKIENIICNDNKFLFYKK